MDSRNPAPVGNYKAMQGEEKMIAGLPLLEILA
jgi:hypothetical protein